MGAAALLPAGRPARLPVRGLLAWRQARARQIRYDRSAG